MNEQYKLFDAEYKFMLIIWENEPINSTQLVKLCNEELGWKKSTTYTVLKKLQNRDILKNEKAIVTSLVKFNEVRKYESEQLLDKAFNSSLPKFLATFLNDKKITDEEAEELKRIIDESRG
ncbi:BlaI/MecI/CopY family transcriptional regulator [Vallitalea guaymasensis]|uniref:BlaI/MecI/CopY family transcriptional regulator n=1 Tax=Vallitalea guaymasensis TaxID=1185412 RepID=A0A8J8SD04_9FIRM|nr:BlaI/MecI/CopY family transcriptional regulator [Vallitalea guaymasensis]QUH29950.1 BlaI/MecI/CopY family transcriptional regulator [Vallitalea guaymasensis]